MTCVFLSTALPLSFLCLLHTSTPASDLFLKPIPFCCVGCHSSYTETFQSISTAWPDTCAGSGYAHKKETKGFWLSWYRPKSSTDSSQHLLQLCFPCVRTTLVSTLKPLVHIFSTECTFCHLFHCSQKAKNWRGPGSVLSHSESSNGITAETKVIHSLALMFVFKFLFKT